MLDRMTSVAEQYGCLRKLRSPMLTATGIRVAESCTWVTRSRDVAGDPAAKALRIACSGLLAPSASGMIDPTVPSNVSTRVYASKWLRNV